MNLATAQHTKPARAEMPVGYKLPYQCVCGRRHEIARAEHYDRFMLGCGERVWALQPDRGGPLVIMKYPDMQPGERWNLT